MGRKAVSGIMLTLLLIGILTLTFNIQPAKASGTIYIRADGSVDPDTANITSLNNVTYTFTANIYDEIVVERDNIVVDGAGYTLQGTGSGMGLDLTERSNVTIRKMGIDAFHHGIWLYESSSINVTMNNITNNLNGIYLAYSSNNTVSENTITDNLDNAVFLCLSSNNTFYRNTVAGNGYCGIIFDSSSYNCISGNRITSSPLGILLFRSANNNLPENNIAYTYECAIKLEKSYENSISGNNVTIKNNNGILLERSHNNILFGNTIINSNIGIFLEYSGNNSIIRNTITDNYEGVRLDTTQDNRVCKNNIAGNTMHGISLLWSFKTIIYANTIKENNYDGIWLEWSYPIIYHNNFLDNVAQVRSLNSTNVWDDSYPSGGNYWSDYIDVDLFNGPDQNESGSDGIGDTAYVIDANNRDNYPLIGIFYDFSVTSEHNVQTICNSTISDFQFNGKAISFNVIGENGTSGFCRICIPTALMNDTYKVFVNGTEVEHTLLPCSNSTYSYLYFTYNHSTQEVVITPEFPMQTPIFIILVVTIVIIFIVLTVALTIYKRRLLKTPIH